MTWTQLTQTSIPWSRLMQWSNSSDRPSNQMTRTTFSDLRRTPTMNLLKPSSNSWCSSGRRARCAKRWLFRKRSCSRSIAILNTENSLQIWYNGSQPLMSNGFDYKLYLFKRKTYREIQIYIVCWNSTCLDEVFSPTAKQTSVRKDKELIITIDQLTTVDLPEVLQFQTLELQDLQSSFFCLSFLFVKKTLYNYIINKNLEQTVFHQGWTSVNQHQHDVHAGI